MFERFKAWLKSRNMTTPCQVMPGDILVIHIRSTIERPCDLDGVTLGMFHHAHEYTFEWEATRPFRTKADAILACSATLDVIHVQGSKHV